MSRTEDNLQEYIKISELIKILEERKKKIRDEVVQEVGKNAVIGQYKIYTQSAKKFQVEAFKQAEPLLYQKYLKESAPVTYIGLNKKL